MLSQQNVHKRGDSSVNERLNCKKLFQKVIM